MREWLAQPVLSIDGHPVTGVDLVVAGALNGEWAAMEDALARSLRLPAPAPDVVVAERRQLRYQYRLLSAREYRDWLAACGLTAGQVDAALARRAARREATAPPTDDGVLDAIPAEAVVSGTLRRCATWLVERLVIGGPTQSTAAVDPSPLQRLRVAPLLDQDVTSRLSRIRAADAAYRAFVERVANPEAVGRHVAERRLEWSRFELEGLRAATRSAAAEAVLLVRDDGVELDEAARRAATAVERCTWRLEEAPDRLAPLLAAAMPGDVLGPVPEDATHALWRVLSREPAAADDPELVRRAQREIVAAHIRRAAAGRVSYLKPV